MFGNTYTLQNDLVKQQQIADHSMQSQQCLPLWMQVIRSNLYQAPTDSTQNIDCILNQAKQTQKDQIKSYLSLQ